MDNIEKCYEEGDKCSCTNCMGLMGYDRVENCSCHLNPPCNACYNNPLVCLDCGFNPEEDEVM